MCCLMTIACAAILYAHWIAKSCVWPVLEMNLNGTDLLETGCAENWPQLHEGTRNSKFVSVYVTLSTIG